VAFSGEVTDPESGPDPFRERSTKLNTALEKRAIFYRLLVRALHLMTAYREPGVVSEHRRARVDSTDQDAVLGKNADLAGTGLTGDPAGPIAIDLVERRIDALRCSRTARRQAGAN
jgi:hypothetical protein